ncbi:chemerin-like receptor 1 [Dendrobates tinctorius]|uniref:chemerin-like receptor 1 n=1 Tax=Dendrobates tinctorius TaxID=92724 RepID=UPI003CCA13DC
MESVTDLISLENETNLDYTYYYENYTRSYHKKSIAFRDICFVVTCSVFCLLGIIGNGLVIYFGLFRMKKTVNVVWFLSLAVADFIFSLLYPVNIIQHLLKNWSNFSCKLMQALLFINTSVSVLQLTVISVDRCICIVFPVLCHNHRRPRLAIIIALIIWILSFVLATPSIIYVDTFTISDATYCTTATDFSIIVKKTVLGFVFYFLLPFIVIACCYIVIVLYIRRKRIFSSSKPFKTMAAIIIAFFICWFPNYLIHFFIIFRHISINVYVIYYGKFIALILIIMNSCINPILYVFIGRDFKEKCCGSFQVTFEKAFLEDEEKAQEGNIALTRGHTEVVQ